MCALVKSKEVRITHKGKTAPKQKGLGDTQGERRRARERA